MMVVLAVGGALAEPWGVHQTGVGHGEHGSAHGRGGQKKEERGEP